MSQLKRASIWLAKVFLGYAIIATPTFALLYWALRISVKQILPPYFLLFGVTIFGVLLMFNARRYFDQPTWFRFRASVYLFVILLSYSSIIYYFGNEYGLIKPDYTTMLIATGFIGAGGVSLHMFFYLRHRLHLRKSKK
jgi:hypothetical protein